MKKEKQSKQTVKNISISLDVELLEQLKKFAEMESLPVSRFIARVLKRYFSMK